MTITERVHDAAHLYDLAENITLEAKLWRDKCVIEQLEHTAAQIQSAARAVLNGEAADYADTWIVTGYRYLDAHVRYRRFLENLTPLRRRTRRPAVNLECRDGQHSTCPICDCTCHRRMR